jgi:hypothetical protein
MSNRTTCLLWLLLWPVLLPVFLLLLLACTVGLGLMAMKETLWPERLG